MTQAAQKRAKQNGRNKLIMAGGVGAAHRAGGSAISIKYARKRHRQTIKACARHHGRKVREEGPRNILWRQTIDKHIYMAISGNV